MKQKGIWYILLFMIFLMAMPKTAQAVTLPDETGGVNILKTDVSGEPLPGARFAVIREATAEEKENMNCLTKTIEIDGKSMEVVYEPFFSDSALQGRVLWEARTDDKGLAAVYGLPMGTHYLLETEAPEGFNRIKVPIRISVNRYSHLTKEDSIRDDAGVLIDNTIHIVNVRYKVPETGNPEWFPLILAGIGVIVSSMALMLISRKRQR